MYITKYNELGKVFRVLFIAFEIVLTQDMLLLYQINTTYKTQKIHKN